MFSGVMTILNLACDRSNAALRSAFCDRPRTVRDGSPIAARQPVGGSLGNPNDGRKNEGIVGARSPAQIVLALALRQARVSTMMMSASVPHGNTRNNGGVAQSLSWIRRAHV